MVDGERIFFSECHVFGVPGDAYDGEVLFASRGVQKELSSYRALVAEEPPGERGTEDDGLAVVLGVAQFAASQQRNS